MLATRAAVVDSPLLTGSDLGFPRGVTERNHSFSSFRVVGMKLFVSAETVGIPGSAAYSVIGNATNPTKVACGRIHIVGCLDHNGTVYLDYSLAG